jgi:hypothetical protein
LKKTVLYDYHVENGGKMVPFAGWSMPVQYSNLGVGASHNWTRNNASVFDVSHMLATRYRILDAVVVVDIGLMDSSRGGSVCWLLLFFCNRFPFACQRINRKKGGRRVPARKAKEEGKKNRKATTS